MTLKQLREHVAKFPAEFDDLQVKVWLPGSTISLGPMHLHPYHNSLLLEGSVDEGSALERLIDVRTMLGQK